MDILRKKKVSTRMLILLEIVVNRKGSMRQIARSGAGDNSMATRSPRVLSSKLPMSSTRAPTSTGRGCTAWRREKASRRSASPAARSTDRRGSTIPCESVCPDLLQPG